MADVTGEAKAVRDALACFGWCYLGGGPYPHEPVMRFLHDDGRRIEVTVRGSTKKRDDGNL